MGPVVDKILYQAHRDEIFQSKDNLFLSNSNFSSVQVWELGRTKSARRHMNDGEFRQYLKVCCFFKSSSGGLLLT